MFLLDREVLILFWLLLAGAGSVVGVVAIWAGLGRTFWFWRIAALGAVLSLTLVMSAYGLLLIFTVQSVVVVAPLMAFRIFRRRKEASDGNDARWSQFTIRDLLLLTVVVAVVSAVLASMPPQNWEGWGYILGLSTLLQPRPASAIIGRTLGIVGLIFGLSTLAAAGIGLTRRRLWLRLIVLVVYFPAALMSGWLMLLQASDYFARGPTEHPRVRRTARTALVLLTLIVVVPLSVVYWVIAIPPRVPEVVLPNPNGYDDLAAAAGELKNMLVPDADIATAAQLKAFTTKCQPVLRKARIGLGRDCKVPVTYGLPSLESVRIQETRSLARTFAAEGKLAEMEGRTDDAVEAYLDAIRMGRAWECGGLIIHAVLGWAWERIGMARLAELRHSLTTKQCRELIATLESLNAGREPLEDYTARDRVWVELSFGWLHRLTTLLERVTGADQWDQQAFEDGDNRRRAYFRLLITDLAIRCYEADHGKPPGALGDLAPEYLAEVPEDPFGGEPLVYRLDATGYLLYSIGPDETDDGGASDSFGGSLAGGDILLDEPEEQPAPIDDESLWE